MNLSPIAFFAYNRPYHTIKSLESLKKNKLSKKSDLIIFVDGPKNESGDKEKVDAVKKIINDLKGFKSKKIFFRRKNLGLSKNFISGISHVLNLYKKIIVVEDDNILSEHFLDYMNKGLNTFQNEKNICAINGYSYPVEKKGLDNFFLVKGADTWGWGTWKKTWDKIIWNPKLLLKKIDKKKISEPKIKLLIDKIQKRNDSYTIMFDISMQIQNKYSVVPKISYSSNFGLDGSGRHAKTKVDIFNSKLNNSKPNFDKKKILFSKLYEKRVKEFHDKNLVQKKSLKFLFTKYIKKILSRSIQLKLKKTLFPKVDISFKNNDKNIFVKYYDDYKFIKQNILLLELVKKNFLLTLVDGKLKNINQANFFLLNNLNNLFKRYNNLRIIEYGGGVGQRYYEFCKLVGTKKKINWTIIEQKKYCEYSNKKNKEIKFLKSFESLSRYNKHTSILIYSTSLQYLNNPHEELKKVINNENIKYLFIENLPLSGKKEKNLLQTHYTDKRNFYSFKIFNNKKVMKLLNKKFNLQKKKLKKNIKKKNLVINFNF